MKRKKVLALAPKPTGQAGEVLTVQTLDRILIINYWKDKRLIGRYCLNTESGEYQTYLVPENVWTQYKLRTLCASEPVFYDFTWHRKITFADKKDEQLAQELLASTKREVFTEIDMRESNYQQEKREAKEWRRKQRIETEMKQVPELPGGFIPWVLDHASPDYLFYRKEKNTWFCSLCEKTSAEETIIKALAKPEEDGGELPEEIGQEASEKSQKITKGRKPKIRHNDQVICPWCKKVLQAKKKGEPKLDWRVIVLQEIDEEKSVARHLDIRITWSEGKRLQISEGVRLIVSRKPNVGTKIYYNQFSREHGFSRTPWFDDKHNLANRRMGKSLLYPEGISQALTGTVFVEWKDVFAQMAAAGAELDYNRMMLGSGKNLVGMMEYLFKGRFSRLLNESIEAIFTWSGEYHGTLHPWGSTEKEVFGISDKQKINRIRQRDGGELMVDWMRWAEESGRALDEETLSWLEETKLCSKDLRFITDRMSPRQAMNYIKKQQAGEYAKMAAKRVLDQWKDYLSMAETSGRDTLDEMVYRPRQLKRRHDELVEETRKRQMLENMEKDRQRQEAFAKEMAEKFPGAEENLRLVKKKFTYENGEYRIIVPDRLLEIIVEGNALHHCAGATERYFERIMTKETYICFLRKCEEPETPFYTIEVEPGGTIRQHRSMYDEEPGIEEIRGFLREWQKVIKQRMSREDRHLAKESAVKREQNLEELRQKNNLRVLEGLMQDFMEAM